MRDPMGELIETPPAVHRIAARQTIDAIRYYGRAAASTGTVDLNGLALSCYLQGAVDVLNAISNSKIGVDPQ
jgi:hypothetical protein